jgi:lipid A 4'-phosphatase
LRILGWFLATSLLFIAFPGIDIFVSSLFFDGQFPLNDRAWQSLQQRALGGVLGFTLLVVLITYAYNKWSGRNVLAIDGRKVCYLFLVLILGAGLFVNAGLKDHFGRARPRDVAEFGGSRQFTPAFALSNECRKNCSFSSGDAAAAFFFLALAVASRRRRAMWVAALGFGVLVSLSRLAAGAHFLSDVAVSFFVMLLVADLLHHYIVLGEFQREAFLPRASVFPPINSAAPVRGRGTA